VCVICLNSISYGIDFMWATVLRFLSVPCSCCQSVLLDGVVMYGYLWSEYSLECRRETMEM
jgi:hypothetical protein